MCIMHVLSCIFWANGNDVPNCHNKLSLSLSLIMQIVVCNDKIMRTSQHINSLELCPLYLQLTSTITCIAMCQKYFTYFNCFVDVRVPRIAILIAI